MKSELVLAAGAVPITLYLMANIGGATATIQPGNPTAVREAIGITAVAMLIAAGATGSIPTTLATAVAVAASVWAMRAVWGIPSVRESVPL